MNPFVILGRALAIGSFAALLISGFIVITSDEWQNISLPQRTFGIVLLMSVTGQGLIAAGKNFSKN